MISPPTCSRPAIPRSRKRTLPATMVASFAALVVVITGCTSSESNQSAESTTPPTLPAFTTSTTPTTTTPPPGTPAEPAVDYSQLLLTAEDVSDDADTFTFRSSTPDADGTPGASVFFVNAEDTRAITNTVVAYPDAQAATAALQRVIADPSKVVSGGSPRPLPVGTDGTIIAGSAPDGGKAVTLLVFTEGHALVRLKFESATGDATTDSFVTNVGKMQQIALRVGLTSPK